MRRLIALALVAGCASAGAPPGGPERHEPPEIVSITPDSGALNVKDKTVEFRFDEVISDRASGGAGTLDAVILVSPRTGAPDVSWHRSRISVKPRGGFRPNTAYRVTLLPGIVDLHNNVLKESRTIVFSTGATVPNYSILGRVFDWSGQRPASGAYIEATLTTDTTVVYLAASDTSGQFEVSPMPAGKYLVRSLIDQNNNRTLDRNEKWDTLTVVVSDMVRNAVELDAIERDSTSALFESVVPIDSVTLRVQFDKPLDPRLPLQPALLHLQRADSSEVPVTSVQWAAQYDQARQARIADSTRRADSVRAAGRGGAPTPPATVQTPGGPRNAPPPAKPSRPPPDRAIIVTVGVPLPPGNYLISGRGFRNLVGRSNDIRRSFAIQKPAPRDTTAKPPAGAPRDTVRPPTRPPLR